MGARKVWEYGSMGVWKNFTFHFSIEYRLLYVKDQGYSLL
jgi:hypothetical protein